MNLLRRWLVAVAWAYFTCLFGWLAVYVLTGDRFGYLGLLNALAMYLFAPLPATAVLAAWTRRRELWAGAAAGAAVFLWLWGGLFLPHAASAQASDPTLRVMTYNLFGIHAQADRALHTLRTQDADVVFLQELDTETARTLQAELGALYPYQILDPVDDVRGMGVLSRYPLAPTGERLPLAWIGVPQIQALEWGSRTVTLVNFHTFATGFGPAWAVSLNFRQREAQAQVLADFAASHAGPLVVAGDANATSLNTTYKIIARELTDAWLEGGRGFGHTFPGTRGRERPSIAGLPTPPWLVRIDYIFHSAHWQTRRAWIAPHDGVSDHRAVVAELIPKR